MLHERTNKKGDTFEHQDEKKAMMKEAAFFKSKVDSKGRAAEKTNEYLR